MTLFHFVIHSRLDLFNKGFSFFFVFDKCPGQFKEFLWLGLRYLRLPVADRPIGNYLFHFLSLSIIWIATQITDTIPAMTTKISFTFAIERIRGIRITSNVSLKSSCIVFK